MVMIYGLVDPRDRQIKYIGQTVDTERRLREHIADNGDTPKAQWIQELRAVGIEPGLVVLDEIEIEDGDGDAYFQENWWILFCRYKQWENVNGTNPGEWRADFGEMFSVSLRKQYDEFSSKLEAAEIDAIRSHVDAATYDVKHKAFNIVMASYSIVSLLAAFMIGFVVLMSIVKGQSYAPDDYDFVLSSGTTLLYVSVPLAIVMHFLMPYQISQEREESYDYKMV